MALKRRSNIFGTLFDWQDRHFRESAVFFTAPRLPLPTTWCRRYAPAIE